MRRIRGGHGMVIDGEVGGLVTSQSEE